jgi:hypothetical protein
MDSRMKNPVYGNGDGIQGSKISMQAKMMDLE